jgi:hypothetical protein
VEYRHALSPGILIHIVAVEIINYEENVLVIILERFFNSRQNLATAQPGKLGLSACLVEYELKISSFTKIYSPNI